MLRYFDLHESHPGLVMCRTRVSVFSDCRNRNRLSPCCHGNTSGFTFSGLVLWHGVWHVQVSSWKEPTVESCYRLNRGDCRVVGGPHLGRLRRQGPRSVVLIVHCNRRQTVRPEQSNFMFHCQNITGVRYSISQQRFRRTRFQNVSHHFQWGLIE